MIIKKCNILFKYLLNMTVKKAIITISNVHSKLIKYINFNSKHNKYKKKEKCFHRSSYKYLEHFKCSLPILMYDKIEYYIYLFILLRLKYRFMFLQQRTLNPESAHVEAFKLII